jgi:hypothetical protein
MLVSRDNSNFSRSKDIPLPSVQDDVEHDQTNDENNLSTAKQVFHPAVPLDGLQVYHANDDEENSNPHGWTGVQSKEPLYLFFGIFDRGKVFWLDVETEDGCDSK